MQDFIADLDAYFCEKYANYDKICILPNYRMPTMQASKVDDFGRTYAYTLPSNTMRLALQENKEELLATLKEQLVDATFSFSFMPFGFFAKLKNKFSKNGSHKHLKTVFARHNISEKEAFENLSISEEIWTNICKGAFAPTKNLIFSLALTCQFTYEETQFLLNVIFEDFDYTVVKDVVVAYLLNQKVFNRTMIDRALGEYKVTNLFLK